MTGRFEPKLWNGWAFIAGRPWLQRRPIRVCAWTHTSEGIGFLRRTDCSLSQKQSDGRPELSICSTHRPRCQKSNARSFLWRTLMRIERADNCSCSLDKQTPPHDYSCDSFAGRVWISVSLWMLVCELSEKFSVLCCCFPACPSVK